MNQINSNSFNILQQRLEMQNLALEILTKSNKADDNVLTELNNTKASSFDTAEFSTESINLCLTGGQSYENTYELDFATGVVSFNYQTNMYTLEDGTQIPLSGIKKVDSSMANTLQAEDNTLALTTNTYYNYTDLDGNDYIFSLTKAGISLADSELALGDYTEDEGQIAVKTGLFLSCLMKGDYTACLDNVFFTDSEKKEILNNLGIKTGKFTITLDGKTSATFYLDEDGTIFSEQQIASKRNFYANENLYDYGYTAEDTFMIDGQEFHIDENGHINIPDDLGMHIEVIRSSDEN